MLPPVNLFNASEEHPSPKMMELCSKESWLDDTIGPLVWARCKSFLLSLSWPNFSFEHSDTFAVVEASLTSTKYAVYHAVGYLFLCFMGYHSVNFSMFLTSTAGGFIGGGLFTLPFIILLLTRDVVPSGAYADDDLASHIQRLFLLVTEMAYSAAAGAVGMAVMNTLGWGGSVIVGVCGGFLGPFISYVILYISLKLLLAVWAVNL